jgi:TetR/AcrR family transcriptional repressor of mexJK operon
MIGSPTPQGDGRSSRKHREILAAAQDAFLTKGYDRTTMDEIAAIAGVSKQTVYKHFVDKESLFAEIVLGTTGRLSTLVSLVTETLGTTTDLSRDLERLAECFLRELMQPDVLRLRRLVISIADRFPAVGRAWYEQGFEHVLETLGGAFGELRQMGLLHVEDPEIAAHHFVGMLLWIPVNKAMFTGDDSPPSPKQAASYAAAATRAFLDAYATSTIDHRRRPGSTKQADPSLLATARKRAR